MVGHAYDGLPDEACGLFAGPPGTDRVTAFYPCRNAAESSRVYTIDPKDHLRADRDAEGRGPRDQRGDAQPHPHRRLPVAHRRAAGARPGLALRDRVAAPGRAGAPQLPHRRRRRSAKRSFR